MTDATENTPDDAVPSRFSVDFTGETLLGLYRVEKKLAADAGSLEVHINVDSRIERR